MSEVHAGRPRRGRLQEKRPSLGPAGPEKERCVRGQRDGASVCQQSKQRS